MNTIYSWDKGWNVGRDFQTEKTSIQKDVKLHIKEPLSTHFILILFLTLFLNRWQSLYKKIDKYKKYIIYKRLSKPMCLR
ncbi:Protein of unknown function [Gryllus bimaculatus]|nr:Protein of unknown function [Gryllus bimaculatus]